MLLGAMNKIQAQNTFSKIIDIDTTIVESNTGIGITANEHAMTIVTGDFCEDNVTCNTFLSIDYEQNVLWRKKYDSYPNNSNVVLGSLTQTIAGNYAINFGFINGGIDCGVLQLSTLGDSLSWHQFCEDAYGIGWHGLRQLPDSSFLSLYGIGDPTMPETTQIFFANIDNSGTIISQTAMQYDINGNVLAYDTCSNGYFMAEKVWDNFVMTEIHATIRRTNLLGVPIWTQVLNDIKQEQDANLLLIAMKNGNVAVAWDKDTIIESTNFYPNTRSILCLDGNNGNILWRVYFLEPYSKEIHTIRVAQNGDIIGCGYYEPSTGPTYAAGWMFRISPQGQLLWEHIYYNSANTAENWYLFDLTETPDGHIAATGSVLHQNNQNQLEIDAWLLKVDADGCLQSNCAPYDLPVSIDKNQPIISPHPAVNISPNPATNEITISYPPDFRNQTIAFSLYDMYGRLQISTNLAPWQNSQLLDISALPAGFYMYSLSDKRQIIQAGKIIKQ